VAGAPTVPGTRPVPRLHADHVYGRLAELARRRHRSKPAAKATSTATAAARIALLANLRASSLGERRPSDHELSTWDKVDLASSLRSSYSPMWTKHPPHTQYPFNGPLSRTSRVSRYQKGKTNLGFTEARDSEWQWHQLGHMQVCTSIQIDNHASTPPLGFTDRMPFLPPNQQCQSTEG